MCTDLRWAVSSAQANVTQKKAVSIIKSREKKAGPIAIILIMKGIVHVVHSKYLTKNK